MSFMSLFLATIGFFLLGGILLIQSGKHQRNFLAFLGALCLLLGGLASALAGAGNPIQTNEWPYRRLEIGEVYERMNESPMRFGACMDVVRSTKGDLLLVDFGNAGVIPKTFRVVEYEEGQIGYVEYPPAFHPNPGSIR